MKFAPHRKAHRFKPREKKRLTFKDLRKRCRAERWSWKGHVAVD